MLALFVPVLNLLFRYVVPYRVGSIILSALVAHQAWHWMEDRWDALTQFSLPTITPDGIMSALPWLIALVAMAAALWLVSLIAKRWGGGNERRSLQTRGGIIRPIFARQPIQPRFCLEPRRDFGQCLFHRRGEAEGRIEHQDSRRGRACLRRHQSPLRS